MYTIQFRITFLAYRGAFDQEIRYLQPLVTTVSGTDTQ